LVHKFIDFDYLFFSSLGEMSMAGVHFGKIDSDWQARTPGLRQAPALLPSFSQCQSIEPQTLG